MMFVGGANIQIILFLQFFFDRKYSLLAIINDMPFLPISRILPSWHIFLPILVANSKIMCIFAHQFWKR